jgi:hypothetical protein
MCIVLCQVRYRLNWVWKITVTNTLINYQNEILDIFEIKKIVTVIKQIITA